jgi:1-acyl-sn-glycerol-3-phosphate acyltransferase
MLSPLNTAFSYSFTLAMSGAGAASCLWDRSGESVRKVAHYWGVNMCRGCGVTVSVQGGENVDWDAPLIVMANHQSHFDIPVIYAALPRSFGMLAKKELFRVPVFSAAMKGMRCVPIDRANRRQSLQSLREAAEQVKSGKSIVVFPEGTRSPDGRIHDLKKGPFYLADMAGVPIIPIGVRGTRLVVPKNGWLVRPAEVVVSIGTPIPVASGASGERERLRRTVRTALADLSSLELACDQGGGDEPDGGLGLKSNG